MKRNLYKYLGLCLLASSAGMSANAQSTVAKFTKVTTPVPAQKASGSLAAGDFYHSTYCGATWGDYNNDGFLDMYFSDRNLPMNSTSVYSNLYTNNGKGGFVRTTGGMHSVTFSSPVWFDFNNDGHLDLVISGLTNANYRWNDITTALKENVAYLYINQGNGSFKELQNCGLLPIYNGKEGGNGHNGIAVGDYDNDGYTDIIMQGFDDLTRATNDYDVDAVRALYLYRNINGERFEIQPTPVMGNKPLHGLTGGSVVMQDLDGDGWLDILASGYGYSRKSEHQIYWNNGDGTFSEEFIPMLPLCSSSCSVADLNNDGLPDLVLTGVFSETDRKNMYICKNNGDRTFTLLNTEFEGVDGGQLAFGDVNQDGFVDIFMGGHGAEHEHTTWLYLNQGDFKFEINGSHWDDPFGKKGHFGRITHGTHHLIDYNNDGFLDGYMSGWCNGGCSKGCGVELWQNTSAASGIAPNEAPSMPSGLNATFDAKTGLATFTWSAASDDFTPAQGLRYNFFIKKEGSDETFMVLPADVTTGFVKVGNTTGAIITIQYKFKVPTSGTYEWGVQAIDGGNKGSKFQTMKSEFNTSGIVDTQSSKLGASVNIKDGNIHYSANGMTTLRVFNAQGQCAGTYSISESGVINANLGTGLYVVTMSNGSTTVPFKVLAK